MSEFGGRMLFSGANYRRDHQVKVNPPMSEIQYLTRDDPANPCKKYRKNVRHAIRYSRAEVLAHKNVKRLEFTIQESAGEIGWAVENLCPEVQEKPTNIDGKFFGFTKGIFRRAADLRASHRVNLRLKISSINIFCSTKALTANR